ncbi:putative 5'-3' exonuclease XRNC [Trypanosoma conorhini]|uniref:Putative 5'-3' exonuclease XRNC n=1 Tax=Trypanosoma conorhini TaxID=83891 RepID=A0A422QCF5_9TRYP|nr:putative 5'-3' exonuclease XRNC [Trypanosoma conorhini]RNF27615.1 putative 5'-3' exonuclease XRNC [Trypanosoma conorhini]
MGVPLLLTWLKRRFAPCFLPSTSCPAADCLYIDVNGLVYQSAALATASEAAAADIDAAILRKLFDLLDDIVLRLVRPRALVYLAVDGISPMGKLAQQRSRRRRRSSGGSRGGRGAVEWDSNSISVGTPFMSRLTEALHFYCASRAERINGERLRDALQPAAPAPVAPITFVVDDVWRPGEGENKIADAIRRFRSQPTYDPNTSHVICSSDTDVTVCSLILHEPRIHVLRYEYPTPHCGGGGGSSSWRNHVGDGWASTFFSIHAFREELRAKLRLQTGGSHTVDEMERRNRQFERALHDVVFVLLLFGNDFLPSVGCRIEEGFLDDLLELLATDFISRDRSIIDPATNTIQVDAARYALDSLAEMRRERVGGEGLCVDNGKEGAADWGFVDEEFLRRRQAREDTELAPKCYAYWTMLQWSLQNSAGLVEHWGCYYPYSSAPPLHLLRKYCGMLSYEALMELAKKRSHLKHRGATAAAGEVETAASTWGDGPANVLVQLLVLLPARSTALLPSAIRNAYSEVEQIVLAPVEKIDFAAISAWCEAKQAMFTEEERTRFRAYALAATPHVLATEAQGMPIQGNEMIFVADWDSEGFAAELQQAKAARELAPREATETGDGAVKGAAPPTTISTPRVSVSSFFGTRPARTAASAAAVALLAASKKSGVARPPQSSGREAGGDGNRGGAAPAAPADTQQEAPRPSAAVALRQGRGFTLVTAPTAVLGDAAMEKSVGAIAGDTFVCGQHTSAPLSRNPQTMRVRLRWRVASKPLLTLARFVPDLLPGYAAPPPPLPPPSASPQGATAASAKRPRSAEAAGSGGSSGDDGDDAERAGEDEKEDGGVAARNVMSELEKKKEDVRRRLAALQARDVARE